MSVGLGPQAIGDVRHVVLAHERLATHLGRRGIELRQDERGVEPKRMARYAIGCSPQTAGEPAAMKLTPTVGPGGLQADGADVAMFDVEVVDANGQRCPTDKARVDFT
jgi:hypothetical protein